MKNWKKVNWTTLEGRVPLIATFHMIILLLSFKTLLRIPFVGQYRYSLLGKQIFCCHFGPSFVLWKAFVDVDNHLGPLKEKLEFIILFPEKFDADGRFFISFSIFFYDEPVLKSPFREPNANQVWLLLIGLACQHYTWSEARIRYTQLTFKQSLSEKCLTNLLSNIKDLLCRPKIKKT